MKLGTLSFQEILKRSPDVFEAVVILSNRARQIVGRRAAEHVVEEEVLDPNEIMPFEMHENPDYVEENKSATVAMENFLTDGLEWSYAKKEEETGPAEGS